MREIDTDALQGVMSVLGIANPATATRPAEFDDENLQQAFDVTPAIRRSRTVASTEGIFHGRITHTHAIAGTLVTEIDPYDLAAGPDAQTPQGAYPSPIRAGFDLWYLGGAISFAVGLLDTARFSNVLLNLPNASSAFGSSGGTFPLDMWNREAPISAAVAFGDNTGNVGGVLRNRPVRIPRGSTLILRSHAGAAGDIFIEVALGLFPISIGQDFYGNG